MKMNMITASGPACSKLKPVSGWISETGEVLAVGGDQFLDHQRHPRRLFPDNILRLFIEFGFLLRIGGFQRLAQRVIHLRVAVKRGIKQRRRPVLRGEQRRQRPVGFTGGGGPAGIDIRTPLSFCPLPSTSAAR